MYSDLETRAIAFTIGKSGGKGNEGGFSNNKADHGGPTFSGFTLQTVRRLSAQLLDHDFDKDDDGDIDADDLKKMTWDDLEAMAHTYWTPALESISNPVVAIKTYDFGFNCGVQSGLKLLQRAVNRTMQRNALVVDGAFGPKSVLAAKNCDSSLLLANLIQVAKDHYVDIVNHDATQKTFLNGWIARAARLPNG